MKIYFAPLGAGISALGIVLLVIATSAFLAVLSAPTSAHADPNTQTVLPADGVTSIERTADSWIMATDGIPSEVKLMSQPNPRTICSYNASLLSPDSADYRPPCGAVTVFGAAAECVYVQVDGLPGYNSSDPYVCRGSEPTQTTTPASPTESPSPSSTPSSPTSTPSTTPTNSPSVSPTPTESATTPPSESPSPSPTASITPLPTTSPSSTPSTEPTPEPSTPSSTPTETASALPPSASASPTAAATGPYDRNPYDSSPTLASTGLAYPSILALAGALLLTLGLLTSFGRKKAQR